MPNFCDNRVVIRGDKKKLDCLEQAIKKQAKDYAFERLNSDFLNTVIPVPDYLINAEISNTVSVNDRVDWKIENWGTTYTSDPIFNRQDDQTLELTFRSASSPPIYAYETLVEEWDLQVKALFFEPLCCYAGIFDNGKYCRFSDICLENVHDLPKELNDAFGIESYIQQRYEIDLGGR